MADARFSSETGAMGRLTDNENTLPALGLLIAAVMLVVGGGFMLLTPVGADGHATGFYAAICGGFGVVLCGLLLLELKRRK